MNTATQPWRPYIRSVRRVTLVAALALSTVRAAVAQSWQPLGPDGGPVVSIAGDPNVSNRLWVSTGRIGVLRSDDGARSWRGVNVGIPTPMTTDVVRTAGALLVGTLGKGIFRSSDSGDHWSLVEGLPASSVILSLAVDPRFDSIVYVAISNVAALSTLYQSRDAGITFAPLAFPGSATRLVVNALTSRVYAASGSCAFISSDFGATWTAMPCAGGRGPITDFAPDPRFSGVVFIAAQDYSFLHVRMAGGVFRATDGQSALVDVTGPLPTSVTALSFSADGALLAGTVIGIFATRDGAQTWLPSAFPSTRVQRLFAASDGFVFAGTSARGLFESTDGGEIWEVRSRGLRATLTGALALDPRFPSEIWWGSADFGGGLSVSSDGGGSWMDLSALPTDLRVDAIGLDLSDSRRVFVGGSYATTIGALSRLEVSSDRGLHWQVSTSESSGFGSIDGFAFDPLVPGRVLAGGYTFLNESRDSGATWSVLLANDSLSPVFDPENPRRAYTTTHSSVDGGVTWAPRDFQIASARRIVVGPRGVLYLGGDTGVWRSDDFGATFRAANAGIEDRSVQSLAVDRRSGAVYAGLAPSTADPAAPTVYRTTDGGASWIAIADGLPQGQDVSALAIDPTWGAVYAGTLGGVYRWIPPSAFCSPDSTTLCLGGGRFRAQVAWSTGVTPAPGQARPLTADAGAFWFFSANNLELVVKVVDGSAVNGDFWVFGGGLTDVEYDLSITDTATGAVWRRHNAGGELASFADTAAFRASPALQ
jgi:hypothetical protein